MELQDYLNVVRKRWRVIALVTLVVTGLAALITILSPKVYASTTEFFVSTTGSDASQLQQGSTFTQQRVKTYSQLLETPKALDPVIDRLGLKTTADDLAKRISATVPLDTVLIDVEVTGPSAASANEIAGALGETFPSVVEQIEQVKPGQAAPVKVTVVKDAASEPAPVSPKPARNIVLGLVLGSLAGVGLALLRDAMDSSVKGVADVEAVTDKTVLVGIGFDSDASEHSLIAQVDPPSPRAGGPN